jgi:hypothetical protein
MTFLSGRLTFTAKLNIGYIGEELYGDGSLVVGESDGASPYPYFKINTN